MDLLKLSAEIDENFDETVEIRRHMHMYPELSFEEEKTAAFIAEKLREFGYDDVQTNVGGRGVIAILQGGKPGVRIALRADFDALEIQEDVDLPYASKIPGVMHACGHDSHTATLLSVAKVLRPMASELSGSVLFLFQPAEEIQPGGALGIIASGVLDGVDYIFGEHVAGSVPYDGLGKITPGYSSANSDRFEIFVQGRGGHGSAPHNSVDATLVCAYIIEELQSIVSRSVDPIEPAVVSVASFITGNQTFNIISDTGHLKGSVRTSSAETRALVEKRMGEIVASVCEAHHAEGRLEYHLGYPALLNHPDESAVVLSVLGDTISIEEPGMGGEDFAYYVEKIPGAFFYINAGMSQDYNYPHHHPKFAIDERCMAVGAKAFLKLVDHYVGKGANA